MVEMIAPFFTIEGLEQEIFQQEGIRVIFRAPITRKIPGLSYKSQYTNRIETGNVSSLLARIGTVLTHAPEIGFDIIDGSGKIVSKQGVRLNVIRRSYSGTVTSIFPVKKKNKSKTQTPKIDLFSKPSEGF